jgi:hypothetical protein
MGLHGLLQGQLYLFASYLIKRTASDPTETSVTILHGRVFTDVKTTIYGLYNDITLNCNVIVQPKKKATWVEKV